MIKHTAYELKGDPDNVLVPALGPNCKFPTVIAKDRGYPIVTLAEARKVFGESLDNRLLGEEADRVSYADAINRLPEAQIRPRSAMLLIEAHNAKSMPLEQAARFLRGLPSEIGDYTAPAAPKAVATQDRAKLRRQVELKHGGLSRNINVRPSEAKAEHTKLGYALKLMMSGTDPIKAVAIAGVDTATL